MYQEVSRRNAVLSPTRKFIVFSAGRSRQKSSCVSGRRFFTTAMPKSLFFVEALRYVLRRSILPSAARVRILFDSKHAVKGRAGCFACNEERHLGQRQSHVIVASQEQGATTLCAARRRTLAVNVPVWPLLLVLLVSHQVQRQRQMAWNSVLHNACDPWG